MHNCTTCAAAFRPDTQSAKQQADLIACFLNKWFAAQLVTKHCAIVNKNKRRQSGWQQQIRAAWQAVLQRNLTQQLLLLLVH